MAPLNELQIGYLAGILDGEGQLGITRNIRRDDKKRIRDYALRVEVRISQKRRLLLDTILEWIGPENGSIGRTGLNQAYFVLRLKADWLKQTLPILQPHLILKGRNAEIIIEFFSLGRTHIGRGGASADIWLRKQELRNEIYLLNNGIPCPD